MNPQINEENDILLLVKLLNRELREDFNRNIEKYDLTVDQGRVLFYVCCQEEQGNVVHQKDIQNRGHLSKSSVSEIVDRMVKKELLIKESEYPFVNIKPTTKGRDIVEHIHNTRYETIEKLFKGVDENQRQRIIDDIKQLLMNMKEDENICGKK